MEDCNLIEESETDGLIRQLSEAHTRIKELELEADGVETTMVPSGQYLKVLEKYDTLQRLCDDYEDKLRRIANSSATDFAFSCDKTDDYKDGFFDGHSLAETHAAKIASGPLGPDWRSMCKEAAELIDEFDNYKKAHEWLKEYKEISQ
jgi:hypothetical protein